MDLTDPNNPYLLLPRAFGAIGAAAADCLEELSPLGRPAEVKTIHGTPKDDAGDWVGCWVLPSTPTLTENWPDPLLESIGFNCHHFTYVLDFQVGLRRKCQPTITNDPDNPLPDGASITAAGEELLVDFAILSNLLPVMVQQTFTILQNPQLLATGQPYVDLHRVLPGDVTPHDNGDVGGWNWRFRVEWDRVPHCDPDCPECGGHGGGAITQ